MKPNKPETKICTMYLINRNKKASLALVFILLCATTSKGQAYTLSNQDIYLYAFMFLISFICLAALFAVGYALYALRALVEDSRLGLHKKGEVDDTPAASFWTRLNIKMTGAVPLEQEAAIELNHSYDGIRELDNHLPPWWKYLFYFSIVFSVIYLFVYHISGSLPLQTEEYDMEMALAEEAKTKSGPSETSDIDETNATLTLDPADLSNGKEIYLRNCAACHKETGAGGIGPNLTDEYWLHGGSIKDIFSTIKFGVPDKGMLAWEQLLSPTQIRDAASFIKSLEGTNPENAKAPQGDLYKEPEDSSSK
ncbi:MAG: cbb3-type cytochrome c oxidase N-terminal domain-containing protein [Cyclobacteriaceae bacterium]